MSRPLHIVRRAAVALALVAAAGAARAQATPPAAASAELGAEPALRGPEAALRGPEARFDAAARAMTEGAPRRAAEDFVRLAEDHPDHPLAAEALFSAARLYEERLAEPARALALYRALIERHPRSRTALAASRRAEAIAGQIGPAGQGDQALARFTEILQGFSTRPEAASIAAVEALLAEYPAWSGAPRALLWLAQVHRRAGRYREALARYVHAAEAAPGSDEAFHAWRGAGDMAARLGRFDVAAEHYERMPVADDPARLRSLEDAREHLARERLRAHGYRACFAVIALALAGLLASLGLAAGSARRAARALAAVPTEVVFMLPIAALLSAASFTGHQSIGPAVTLVCAGGLVLAWLSGAGLELARRREAGAGRLRPPAHAVAVALAVLALCYIALHRGHLLDMILETVRFGPAV